jgi:hypothetical protein
MDLSAHAAEHQVSPVSPWSKRVRETCVGPVNVVRWRGDLRSGLCVLNMCVCVSVCVRVCVHVFVFSRNEVVEGMGGRKKVIVYTNIPVMRGSAA